VPGVASVQARVPARREGGREFQALGPDDPNTNYVALTLRLRFGGEKMQRNKILLNKSML